MNGIILFISGPEIMVIFVFVLLLFGAKKIPEIARGLGKGLNEFKKAANDIKKEINDSGGDISKDIKDIKDTLK